MWYLPSREEEDAERRDDGETEVGTTSDELHRKRIKTELEQKESEDSAARLPVKKPGAAPLAQIIH
jgi:hypothetical protein